MRSNLNLPAAEHTSIDMLHMLASAFIYSVSLPFDGVGKLLSPSNKCFDLFALFSIQESFKFCKLNIPVGNYIPNRCRFRWYGECEHDTHLFSSVMSGLNTIIVSYLRSTIV